MLSDEGTKKRKKPIEERNTFSYVVFSTIIFTLMIVAPLFFMMLIFLPGNPLIALLIFVIFFSPKSFGFFFGQLPYKPIDYNRDAIKRSILHKLYFLITSPVFIFGFILSYYFSKGLATDYFFSSNAITILGTFFFSTFFLLIWITVTLKLWEKWQGSNSSQTLRLRRNRSTIDVTELDIMGQEYDDIVHADQRQDSDGIDLTEMDALLQEYEDYDERVKFPQLDVKPQLNFYYDRLFRQFLKKKNIPTGKLYITIMLIIPGLFAFWLYDGIGNNTISYLIAYVIMFYMLDFFVMGFISVLGYLNYNYERKQFSNMIFACQTNDEKEFLGTELARFEAKDKSRTSVDSLEIILYEFFKAKYLLATNQIKESIELFDLVSKKIKKKFHLFYEVNFQIGKIYEQMDYKEQAISFLETAYKGFKKFKYDEPVRDIEELHIITTRGREKDENIRPVFEDIFNFDANSNSTNDTVLAGKKKTSSNEWFLFCSLFPNTISLLIIILSEIYTSYGDTLFVIGYLISFGLFLWLLTYDAFFIKNGYKIGLFETIRVPLNKKNRVSDDLPALSFLFLFMQTPISIFILFSPNYYLYADLVLLAIEFYFIHEIWHVDEISNFLLRKGIYRIDPAEKN